ncbi:ribonuclease VapC26 [Sphaerisporangium siamense]|uniref:Ribonuclease VapC n=1 Tax=Sphaerisporangium siamense TaxID=795645 RepID=A0A7W7D5P5_9ACTN|nr:PIN domain-containing protein [Sphaerisporangium siamense]MBB4700459.1 putative nucleic acid-binding protein [Sphaerisporangium siamense]GII88378.1 ribonuclease VapC26 [Sphaerisporangium siamense]
MTIVVDTSAILALFDEAYDEHRPIAEIVTGASDPLVVSPLIVAEVDYMLWSRFGAAAARRFAEDIVSGAYDLAEWTADDHAAALAVTSQYQDDKDYVGFADASNVVLADRYRTIRLLTLDQRHFRRLRPLWGADHFVLLPYDA